MLIFFKKSALISFIFTICWLSVSFAGILDNWQDPKAYKPNPVLFAHGFARGRATDWNGTKAALFEYFFKYQPLGPYLETIDFQDPNGSVDTYDSGKVNPQGNSDGWADKLKDKVNELIAANKYGAYTDKLNLVCHSMGGLAARWYLTNYSSSFVNNLILIGVPHKGSEWADGFNTISAMPKTGWFNFLIINCINTVWVSDLDVALYIWLGVGISGEAIDDMDPTYENNGFLDKLNTKSQPININYYGVIGTIGSILNWIITRNYYGGDCMVSKDSQLGTKVVSYKKYSEITAAHWDEIKVAGERSKAILSFLDDTKPGIEITSPNPQGTVEIPENSIHVVGKVYKEYLPADSQLIITVSKEDGSYSSIPQSSYLKPSDLWIPKNPDSPVAEFDEEILFPGSGEYEITCQVKNPAGITSDQAAIKVKVMAEQAGEMTFAYFNPVGAVADKRPPIYAKVYANSGPAIDLNSIEMYLDDIVCSVEASGNSAGTEAEIRYNPPSDIGASLHNVRVSAKDITGRQSGASWTFTVMSIPASPGPNYAWSEWLGRGYLSSSVYKYYPGYSESRFPSEVFQQKLQLVKDTALLSFEYRNFNNGLYFQWQGSDWVWGGGIAECVWLSTSQTVNFNLPLSFPNAIPVYTVVEISPRIIDPFNVSHFIKLVRIDINGQAIEWPESYQEEIAKTYLKKTVLLLPYAPVINITYSYDPAIYTFADNTDPSWPRKFNVTASTCFDITVHAAGWYHTGN